MSSHKKVYPNVYDSRSWQWHILFWVITYLFYLAPYLFVDHSSLSSSEVPLSERWIWILFRLLSIMAASYFISYRILPRILTKSKTIGSLTELIIGFYVLWVLSRVSVVYLLEPYFSTGQREQESIYQIMREVDVLFFYYGIGITTGTFPFLFIHQLLERQATLRKQVEVESQRKSAELRALKSQLNPHFLFNTLNNLYSLAVQQSPQTPVVIEKLSNILDYLLYRCNEDYVPLEKEVALLTNYIELEKLRYSSHLNVEVSIGNLNGYKIAPLILLALVENMVKHGLEKNTGEALLRLSLTTENSTIIFTTENTYDPTTRGEQGLGLKNIRQQLELLYGQAFTLKTDENDSMFFTHLQVEAKV